MTDVIHGMRTCRDLLGSAYRRLDFLTGRFRKGSDTSSMRMLEEAAAWSARQHEMQRTLLQGQIHARWFAVDFLAKNMPQKTVDRVCPLCGREAAQARFRQLRSHCMFGGGELLRHVCPACDVTFGPDKMLDLTPSQLAEDYEWHYRAYQEGDSTERELRAFFALQPERQGVYLNYGAGSWSSSVQQLRAQGWNVHAYEPHRSAARGEGQEWLVSSSTRLNAMRFDGIFSNNVLEHFRHPVEELQAMRRLLREGGRMAHATPCFEYVYEYTRFHLFFFTGRSKHWLMEQAGLEVIDEVVDGDFMCPVLKARA